MPDLTLHFARPDPVGFDPAGLAAGGDGQAFGYGRTGDEGGQRCTWGKRLICTSSPAP
jgi:hypothetical protein